MMRKKRSDIVIAAQVSHNGVRYEVVLNKQPGVFDKAGSVVAAYSEEDDALLWSVNVFDYPMPEDMEGDKKTVFIGHWPRLIGGTPVISIFVKTGRVICGKADSLHFQWMKLIYIPQFVILSLTP